MEPLRIAHHIADAAFDAWLSAEGRTDLRDEVGMGADGTPTIRADDLLETACLDVAAKLGISVLSEEAGFVDNGSELVAVLDPLDGSRNAGRGIPFHCVSVGIGRADCSQLDAGVVQNLVTGDVYAAAAGKGATQNGEPVVPRPFDPEEVMVAVIADSSMDEVKQEQQRRGHHLRDLGSAALEMCLVGTGALDAFIVNKPWLRVIDIAAGTLFVREAGGLVVDPGTGTNLATPFDLTVRTGIHAATSADALRAVQ